jgi:hypothetical protein
MRTLFVAIATVGILLAQGSPKERVAEEKRSASTEPSSSTQADQQNPGVTVIVKQENAPQDKPETSEERESIAVQNRIATFTKWLFVVGLLQAGVLALTIKAINRQTKAQRAWISVDVEWDKTKWSDGKFHIIDGSGTSGDHTLFDLVLVCRNEGKSPAWIDEKRAKCELFTEIPPTPNLAATEVVQLGPEPIGIGQAIPHTTKIPWFVAGEGRAQEGTKIVVYGVVKYRDAFGKYKTTFGYQIRRDGPVRLPGHPEYNKNT